MVVEKMEQAMDATDHVSYFSILFLDAISVEVWVARWNKVDLLTILKRGKFQIIEELSKWQYLMVGGIRSKDKWQWYLTTNMTLWF